MTRETLRTTDDLLQAGFVSPDQADAIAAVAKRYAVAVPPALAALISDAGDPIGRQFVPDAAELETRPEDLADPIGDDAHSPVEGIVHRYPDRVLLKLTHVCAVYCRFCFRRETVGPGKAAGLSPDALVAALRYIATHPQIWEVILTGGDPLVLSARRLREAMRALDAIAHVKIVRVHTRLPVAAPERITTELVRALKLKTKATYVAVHVNHARELTDEARAALARLADAGLPLLGQSVLLRGVNDTVEALEELMRALVEARVKPYYLHHPDLAPGTAHFRLPLAEGDDLVRSLRGRVSGLAQPTYVLDIPGGYGKVPVGASAVSDLSAEQAIVQDRHGSRHVYPPATGAAPSDRSGPRARPARQSR